MRNMGATEHDEPVTSNAWEEVKRGGEAAIQRWINEQMSTRSCVIVLIGSQTADRRWVDYEIRKAWNDGKGVLGIYIHGLLNQNRQTSRKGANPFARVGNAKRGDFGPTRGRLRPARVDQPGRIRSHQKQYRGLG